MSDAFAGKPAVTTGAEALVSRAFAELGGKRVGLVTNHTGRVAGKRLIDVMAASKALKLSAILTPEHGVAGTIEAGAKVAHGVDRATGLPVHSLYGKTAKPTPEMLAGLDVLVFDMQDIGARFYTYISTMGLAMQAAAVARLPFVVLDRPNPLGGAYVSGFVLERAHASFVGLYPIPIAHGLTAGELARMIKGQRYLRGLADLDLQVVKLEGWRRDMLWPDVGHAWVATSPNIPSFETALVYPGTGLLEQTIASEGRGTTEPFLLVGHPAVDAAAVVRRLGDARLPGLAFEATRFTPRPIKGVATKPRFSGQEIPGIRIRVTQPGAVRSVEAGIHLLVAIDAAARARGTIGIVENAQYFGRIAGTGRLLEALDRGAGADEIIAGWQAEVAAFVAKRQKYLLY
ncbi:MAG: DUF1343 domain-containing protein [Hyphomicrobiaceae bacterium]